jgi:hypothetical protein
MRSTTKPATEVMLSELQDIYLKDRDMATYQKIFQELTFYCRSLVLKTIKGKTYLNPDIVQEVALEATMRLMTQYQKPEFTIGSSFAGYLQFKILEVLYNTKAIQEDLTLSLNSIVDSSSSTNGTELEDLAEKLNFTYLAQPSKYLASVDPSLYLLDSNDEAINTCMSVVKEIFNLVGLREGFRVTLGVLQFVKKSPTYENFKKSLNPSQTAVLELTLLEMRNRLVGEA